MELTGGSLGTSLIVTLGADLSPSLCRISCLISASLLSLASPWRLHLIHPTLVLTEDCTTELPSSWGRCRWRAWWWDEEQVWHEIIIKTSKQKKGIKDFILLVILLGILLGILETLFLSSSFSWLITRIRKPDLKNFDDEKGGEKRSVFDALLRSFFWSSFPSRDSVFLRDERGEKKSKTNCWASDSSRQPKRRSSHSSLSFACCSTFCFRFQRVFFRSILQEYSSRVTIFSSMSMHGNERCRLPDTPYSTVNMTPSTRVNNLKRLKLQSPMHANFSRFFLWSFSDLSLIFLWSFSDRAKSLLTYDSNTWKISVIYPLLPLIKHGNNNVRLQDVNMFCSLRDWKRKQVILEKRADKKNKKFFLKLEKTLLD